MTENTSHPKVSVVMPVLNGERYIAEAVESVLDQNYPSSSIELIVVNDGSTDGTVRLLEKYQGRVNCVHHQRNLGIARSVNDGVNAATGDLISFLDSDDGWLPDFLKTQVDYLLKHPDVAMVHSDFMTIDENGAVLEASVAKCRNRGVRPSGYIFPQLFMDSLICGNTVLIRKKCFDELGGFDQNLRMGDYDLWLRIAKNYKIDYVDQVLTKYRQHTSQTHRNLAQERKASLPPAKSCAVETLEKILQLYPETLNEVGSDKVRQRLATLNMDAAIAWYNKGIFKNARKCLFGAIGCRPFHVRQYAFLLLCYLKPEHAWTLHKKEGLI